MNPAGRERALRHALAVSLVLWGLFSPVSKSATYFPLFASALFGLTLRVSGKGERHLPRSIVRLASIWCLIATWQFVTLAANGDALSATPFARALDFAPVFLLAGLPYDGEWKERTVRISLYAITALTGTVIILGFIQAATGIVYPFPVQLYTGGKLLGLFSHHIPAAGFFSTLAILCLCCVLFWDSPRRQKIFFGTMFLLLLSGSLLSLSRTYFVSLCTTIPLLSFRKNLRVAAIGVAGTVVLAGASIMLLPQVKTTVASIFDITQNPSNVERLYLWKVAGDMIKAHPVAGIGYREWGARISEYSGKYASEWTFTDASFHHAHNAYLHVAAETGLVGLALFLAFWLFLIFILFRASSRTARGGFPGALALGCAFAIVNLCVGGFFENNFGTLLIALLASYVVSLALFVLDRTDLSSVHPPGAARGSVS